MEPWYRFAVAVIKPLLLLLFKRDFSGQERVPRTGGCIVVTNHISYADPLLTALYLHDHGRRPRFLAKSTLFKIPLVRRVLRNAKQIPVFRETADAALAFSAAVDAVRAGECLVIYPEGTVTKEPDYWPMTGKTGVARIALATGAPVIPLVQWGTQLAFGRDHRPRFFPRKKIVIRSGEPIDLSRWYGAPLTADTLRDATEAVMRRLAGMLGEVRGETPPEQLFVPARRGGAPADDSRRSA